MLGGIALVVHYLTHPQGETPQYILNVAWVPAHLIGSFAWVLVLIGLVGLYARHSERLGRLGSIGFILAFAGGVFRPGELLFVGTVTGPLIATQDPGILDRGGLLYFPLLLTVGLITVIYGFGYFLIAIASVRAALLPRWATWLVIIAVPLALGIFFLFAIGNVAGILFSFGLVGWGYALWSGEGAAQTLPPS